MRALTLHDYGSAPSLTDVDEPTPSDGYVVVPVIAAGLNPVDVAIAAGELGTEPPPPRVLGNEAVVSLDGRPVYAYRTTPRFGSFAERTLVDPAHVLPVPDDVEPAAALIAGISGQPAWIPLETTAAVKPGETVLVLGATGAAGQVAVQAAALLGAGRVIAAGRHLPTLRSLLNRGADRIVALDGSTQDADALLDATGGGADVVFDPVWGPAFVSALRATRPGGRTVTIGGSGGAPIADIPIFSLLGKSMLTYRNRDTPPEVIRAAFDRMLRHIARGELIVDTKQFRLDEAEQAWKLQQDTPHAKLSLLP